MIAPTVATLTRALDVIEALLDAAPQSGPDATDRDIDHAALAAALQDAEALLIEQGRRLP